MHIFLLYEKHFSDLKSYCEVFMKFLKFKNQWLICQIFVQTIYCGSALLNLNFVIRFNQNTANNITDNIRKNMKMPCPTKIL
jgi:hypothetical protein